MKFRIRVLKNQDHIPEMYFIPDSFLCRPDWIPVPDKFQVLFDYKRPIVDEHTARLIIKNYKQWEKNEERIIEIPDETK